MHDIENVKFKFSRLRRHLNNLFEIIKTRWNSNAHQNKIKTGKKFKGSPSDVQDTQYIVARLRNHNATDDGNVDLRSFKKILYLKLGK